MNPYKRLLALLLVVLLGVSLAVGVVACGPEETTDEPATEEPATETDDEAAEEPAAEEPAPATDPAALTEMKCSGCHPYDRVTSADPRSAEDWASTVDRMKANGLQITDEEYDIVVDYLAAEFGS